MTAAASRLPKRRLCVSGFDFAQPGPISRIRLSTGLPQTKRPDLPPLPIRDQDGGAPRELLRMVQEEAGIETHAVCRRWVRGISPMPWRLSMLLGLLSPYCIFARFRSESLQIIGRYAPRELRTISTMCWFDEVSRCRVEDISERGRHPRRLSEFGIHDIYWAG